MRLNQMLSQKRSSRIPSSLGKQEIWLCRSKCKLEYLRFLSYYFLRPRLVLGKVCTVQTSVYIRVNLVS
ncbi:hypothetical protein MKW98_005289 [Papaver atlanticum]|uniref:Uncharacterized protein n=1 Tax=Papaver atlanticum TaxID=357466 RepID=A0AAD4RX24_9MAGN|nr:hypothetical protein MKW98_005289 [Papaver atlanticum]